MLVFMSFICTWTSGRDISFIIAAKIDCIFHNIQEWGIRRKHSQRDGYGYVISLLISHLPVCSLPSPCSCFTSSSPYIKATFINENNLLANSVLQETNRKHKHACHRQHLVCYSGWSIGEPVRLYATCRLKLFRLYGRVHVTYTATSPEECYLIRQLLKLDSRWLYLQYSTEFVIDFSMISATTRSFIHPSLQVSSCNSSSRALIGAEGLCNLYIIVYRLVASSY